MAAKKETRSERAIVLIGGPSGSGKSFFIANLKNALIFDTDIGGGLSYADERILRNGSERIEVATYSEIENEIKARRRDKRLESVRHVAIDHLTILQQEAMVRYNPKGEADYGRGSVRADGDWRRLRELLRNLDFNIFATSHVKSKWEENKTAGVTTDAAKNVEGDFEIYLVLQAATRPTKTTPSMAIVRKWRRDPDDPVQPPDSFPFTMENFQKLYVRDLNAKRIETALATPAQVETLTELMKVIQLPEAVVDKWAKTGELADMTSADIQKRIDYCGNLVAKAREAETK